MIQRLIGLPGSLLQNPRKLLLAVVGGLLALVMLVVVCNMVSGGGSDSVPVSEIPVMSVEEQVAATVAASAPTVEPTATPDVPATLVVAAEQTREANQAESQSGSSLIFGGPSGSSGAGENGSGAGDGEGARDPFAAPAFTRADERFIVDLGPALWYSARLHMSLETLLQRNPDELFDASGLAAAQQADYDHKRIGRELGVLERRWEELSPRVRDYGRHLEGTMMLAQEAAIVVVSMYNIASREDRVDYGSLSLEDRREIEQLYWEAKELLNSFNSRMQEYGCSICGELYRAREQER